MDSVASRIPAIVNSQRAESVATLRSLLNLPAFGSTGQGYSACASFIANELGDAGAEVRTIDVPEAFLKNLWGENLEKSADYLPVKQWSPRMIVLGHWPGKQGKPTLHLTQHYDIPGFLPPESEVTVTEGKMFGPAVSRCRAGLVAMIMAAKALRAAHVEFAGDLTISATPDNHLGGESGGGFLAEKGYGKSDMVITGSAGGPDTIGLGYKGALWLKITTHGKASPASEPYRGINAIDGMTKIQRGLFDLGETLKHRSNTWPVSPPEARWPTLVTSQIHGGGHGVPDRCVMFVDRRVNPDEQMAEALDEVKEVIRRTRAKDELLKVDLEVVHSADNAATPADVPLVQIVSKNVRAVIGIEPKLAVFPFYSEFRFFPRVWGSQAINYGPGLPDHVFSGNVEFVVIDDLVAATTVLALSILDVLG